MKRTLLFIAALVGPAFGYTHFEPRQQHPLDLTPDGSMLLALHSTASTLSVFDVGTPARSKPLLIAEIPVSTAPVSVRARTNDEAWVVNEVSDSISVVSLSRGIIIDTLRVPDEPADVAFAAGKAFVSCSRNSRLAVFDATTRETLGEIPIDGVMPRALATSADGTKVYVASLLSGNRTTILHQGIAPAQPAPTHPSLPPPPQVGLIVSADDPRVSWEVLDHDIAEIDTATLTIDRWIGKVGTHLFDLALHPDGSLWCSHSDALNLTRFEPELNGHFADHGITRISLPEGNLSHFDLNPGIERKTSPDPPSISKALSQPTALVFNSDGSRTWIAAFNSDRVAEIETASGRILRRVDLRPAGVGSEGMRGPRALALTDSRLYVLNKLSDTLSTIDPATAESLSEVHLGSTDPMPAGIRQGRGVLYDARLSGNGTVSCATCHLDADRDGLAWDLGDPGGELTRVPGAELSIHDDAIVDRILHPMKGPLLTQPLRGMALNDANPTNPTDGSTRPAEAIVTKFHWRGDKPSIQSFNSTFPRLMGGSLQLPESMDRLAAYLLSIDLHPNPFRALDRSLRPDLPAGDAVKGLALFNDHLKSHCIVCHDYNGGTDQNIDFPSNVGRFQPFKNPPLRLVHQRAGIFDPTPGAESLSGFGLGADGSGHLLPVVHPYDLDQLDKPPLTAAKRANLANLTAFILSYDTGTAPVVGHDLTVTRENRTSADVQTRLELLETQAGRGWSGGIAFGTAAGRRHRLRWDPEAARYVGDDASFRREELLDLLQPGDALTFSGVPTVETRLRSDDRNANGVPDSREKPPVPLIVMHPAGLKLSWSAPDWFPESSTSPADPWLPAEGEAALDGRSTLELKPAASPRRFYRLHRTW